MHISTSASSASPRSSRRRILIAILWILGLFLGMFCAVYAGDSLSSLMLGLPELPMSIVGLLCGMLMPFLLIAFALAFQLPWLLYMISFGKSFAFGFCAAGLQIAFGSAGWLARCVWMFTDLCATPLILFCTLQAISSVQNMDFFKLWLIPALILLILWVDHSFILPFGARIG